MAMTPTADPNRPEIDKAISTLEGQNLNSEYTLPEGVGVMGMYDEYVEQVVETGTDGQTENIPEEKKSRLRTAYDKIVNWVTTKIESFSPNYSSLTNAYNQAEKYTAKILGRCARKSTLTPEEEWAYKQVQTIYDCLKDFTNISYIHNRCVNFMINYKSDFKKLMIDDAALLRNGRPTDVVDTWNAYCGQLSDATYAVYHELCIVFENDIPAVYLFMAMLARIIETEAETFKSQYVKNMVMIFNSSITDGFDLEGWTKEKYYSMIKDNFKTRLDQFIADNGIVFDVPAEKMPFKGECYAAIEELDETLPEEEFEKQAMQIIKEKLFR